MCDGLIVRCGGGIERTSERGSSDDKLPKKNATYDDIKTETVVSVASKRQPDGPRMNDGLTVKKDAGDAPIHELFLPIAQADANIA